jgi:hypothetical protein
MSPIERLEALLVRVQKNATVLAAARARGEWQERATEVSDTNGHGDLARVEGPSSRPPDTSPRPMLALDPSEEDLHTEEVVFGESGEVLAVQPTELGEAALEAELSASETSGSWQEGQASKSQPGGSWGEAAKGSAPAAEPEPANESVWSPPDAPAAHPDAWSGAQHPEGAVPPAGAQPEPSWEAEAQATGESDRSDAAISGAWSQHPPAPNWQEATPEPPPAWQRDATNTATTDLEDEDRGPRTPPPESGPQSAPAGKLGVPEIDTDGSISVAGSHPAVEQLGGTVELEPATSGSLEMLAADDVPTPPPDDYEEALPRGDRGGVYDESLAPPPNVAEDLAAIDRAEEERAARLSVIPEAAMTVPADTALAHPPATRLETGVLARSPVPAHIAAATFEGQRRATAHTFIELLDDSLGLGSG